MASYKRLIENYERREKELNDSLVAFYLQTGHLLLSGKTDQKDDEYNRPYELIAAEISSINDQCREIAANEQRKAELEKSIQTLKKTIQEYEPSKKSHYKELGDYIFQNYTQHFASTFGTVYSALCEEKKYIDSIEGKLAEIAEQLESKDFFSKLVLYVKQSSLKTQLAGRVRKCDELKAEGDLFARWAQMPFKVPVPNAETEDQILERASQVLELLRRCEAEKILVVSHGGTLRALLAAALQIPFQSAWKYFRLSNCSLTGLEYSGEKFVLAFYNDHLILPKADCSESAAVLPIVF